MHLKRRKSLRVVVLLVATGIGSETIAQTPIAGQTPVPSTKTYSCNADGTSGLRLDARLRPQCPEAGKPSPAVATRRPFSWSLG
jgi:hypothetical protein